MLMRKTLLSIKGGRMRKVMFAVIAAMAIIGMLPDVSNAGMVTADKADKNMELRQANLASVRTALERKEVAARLADYGLTPEEVSSRLDQLSDQQIAELAAHSDKINAGGDALGLILTLLIIAILVLLILHFLGYIDLRIPGSRKKNP